MNDEMVWVIGKDEWVNELGRDGFFPDCHDSRLKNMFIDMCKPMLRTEAEENHDVIQAVAYIVPKVLGKSIRLFKQVDPTEARLAAVAFVGAAGHVNIDDSIGNPHEMEWGTIEAAAKREAMEEMVIINLKGSVLRPDDKLNLNYIGVVYSRHSEVSSQHALFVYSLEDYVLCAAENQIRMITVRIDMLSTLASSDIIKLDLNEIYILKLMGYLP